MKRKVASIFSCVAVLVLTMAVQVSFAEEKAVSFTSVQEGGTISIYPDSFPVERAVKGKIKGFTKQEIAELEPTVEVLINEVSQGVVPTDKKGTWVVKVKLTTADLAIKAIVKDKSGNELATSSLQAVASGEF